MVVEKPFGHDLASARALADEIHQYIDESQLYRIDHFLGKMGLTRSSTCGSPTRCSSRSGTATTSRASQITMAESFGVEDRGHFYDPVGALRDVVVNHLMQVVAAAAMEPPAGGDAGRAQGRESSRCSARCRTPTRRTTCAASTTATATSTGVARGLDHRDLRGAAARDRQLALGGRAVLHPHRASTCRVTQTELRAGVPAPAAARASSRAASRAPEPDQLVSSSTPRPACG